MHQDLLRMVIIILISGGIFALTCWRAVKEGQTMNLVYEYICIHCGDRTFFKKRTPLPEIKCNNCKMSALDLDIMKYKLVKMNDDVYKKIFRKEKK